MRQYRHTLAHPDSTEPSTPAGTGKVPVVLLLAMFALAARYCDLDRPTEPGKYWEAGQEYLDKVSARSRAYHDARAPWLTRESYLPSLARPACRRGGSSITTMARASS